MFRPFLIEMHAGGAFSVIHICKCIFWYCISDKAHLLLVLGIHIWQLSAQKIKQTVLISFLQVKKCPRCKKDLKGIGKIEKLIGYMHRDFRQIMDEIEEATAESNIKKFSNLLTEIEKVRWSQYFYTKSIIENNSGVPNALQGGDNMSTDPASVLCCPWKCISGWDSTGDRTDGALHWDSVGWWWQWWRWWRRYAWIDMISDCFL